MLSLRPRRRSGFTFVELVIVIMLLGILAGVAAPRFQQAVAHAYLKTSAKELDPIQPEIEGLLANGAAQKFIAQCYGTTEANLHNWLKKRGVKRIRPTG